ncbi:unnamed protein product [Effrenium voratum]|uniref:Uncharacterized protein n=1 Tax=Effrenium voratum TaxID=2562239 RepID=A0AA36MZU1_9DINO|nr:unnamed protein product [Effrenium voratum]
MGCSASEFEAPNRSGKEMKHSLDGSEASQKTEAWGNIDPASSWNMTQRPSAPVPVFLAPDKKMHDRHLKKLDKFRQDVERDPESLARRIERKRRAANMRIAPA